jgi:2-hydroxycyclohexanecarboxyl-CoA dehydrogenase
VDPAFNLTDRRILLTGAASGTGRAFARLAAAAGAHVALLDINGEGLAETEQSLDGATKRISIEVDLTDWEAVEAAVEGCREALGGFDAVCNIAGWDAPGRFWEQDYEFWRKLIDINLWSTLHVIRATVDDLREQGAGSIVNVGSDAGRVGSKGETVYAAAKGGVIALTKSLARELATTGVTVNCVCPGPTMTPLLEEEMRTNPRLIEKLVAAIPMRRVGEPEDQARAIAFFASPASTYITGQVLSVNGGLTMVG